MQRCQNPDGTTVYTDRACAALGAVANPLPGAVLNRIARDEAKGPADNAKSRPVTLPVPARARRPSSAGCARTPTQLSMDVHGSFALGDVNRLAESYHWVGLSHTQSGPLMQRLQRLVAKPLQNLQYFDAHIGPAGLQVAAAVASNTSGILQLSLGGSGRQFVDFEVGRYAGCYFIRF